jgi:hypothetical protein
MTKYTHGYLSLATISLTYVASISYLKTRPILIVASTAVFALLYIVWGILHARSSNNLHAKVVLEYFLVGLLGLAIVSTLLL